MKKWWIVLVLCACGPSKENSTLAQAAAVHNEATEIGHRTSMGISQLKRIEAKMNQEQSDSLQAIIPDLSEWYESLVEVPGFEHESHEGHDHDDHDGHDHDHSHNHGENYLEGLSADEILAIQIELKKEIQQLEARVIALLQNIKNAEG